MRKTYRLALLLCCLLTTLQTSWAQTNTTLFEETFDTNNGTGGREKGGKILYSGSIASNNPAYDNEGWVGTRNDNAVYGAYQCLKLGKGTGNNAVYGVCTTPDIEVISTSNTITLTYDAVGWGGDGTNTLTVTATGAELSGDTQVTLVNGKEDQSTQWTTYTVTVNPTETSIRLTFSCWRGFLDNVRVVETVSTVPAPQLTDNFLFWSNTTEPPTALTTLIPSQLTTVYYTTDGSEPTDQNGTAATLTENILLEGTTTVKAVAYVENIKSAVTERTYTVGQTVNGITAFKALAEGTEARLFLSDDPQTRITFANSEEAYLRTGSEVLCLDFNTTAAFNPAPATQQHVAGWIIGKRQTVNGRPTLVATANTNTSYLVLAPRKSEALITPNAIAASDINSHIGDWVSIDELKVVNTENTFGLTSAQPYEDAIVDVTGIVTATNTIAPTEAVTFVIDEAQAFASPATDLEHAKVRLKRTLSSSYWNTFCVPFDIAIMEGVREYSNMDGTVMHFQDATGIEAGKPYLVKPTADIVNPEYDDLTLKSTPAQTSGDGNYNFVATYSPKVLATDKTEQFIGTDGKLYYSDGSQPLKGMRAYFSMPANAPLAVFVDGELTGIDLTPALSQGEGAWYDLQGRKVVNGTLSNGKLPKGLYIVNGKKMVIH